MDLDPAAAAEDVHLKFGAFSYDPEALKASGIDFSASE